ncbi:MAG: hypothetical protein HYZ15_15330 [Sphingobacteriales bacterium]|nr:hypothetical protein [Sphingobacteriales bacterium]
MIQVQLLFIFIISAFSLNTCVRTLSTSAEAREENFYKSAFSFVCDSLLKQGDIRDKNELLVNNNFTRFRLEEFSGGFIEGAHINNIFDSLKKESDSLNTVCLVRPTDTLRYLINTGIGKGSIPKFIIFFSKLCNNKMQLDIFLFNPRLTTADYITDYYGRYTTILLQFDSNAKIIKNYSTGIDSN